MGSALAICLFFSLPLSAADKPTLPSDIFSFDKLSQEVRGPLELKFRDLTRSLSIEEDQPGHLIFYRKSALTLVKKIQMVLIYDRQMEVLPDGRKYRIEGVRLEHPDGQAILEERIETRGGENLKYSEARDRILFQGNVSYNLLPGEDYKKVLINADGKELFKFESALNGENFIVNNVYFQGINTLKITDKTSSDLSYRSLTYLVPVKFYSLMAFHAEISQGWGESKLHSIVATKPPGNLLENYKYEVAGQAVFSLNEFLASFNRNIYKRLIVDGVHKLMSYLAESQLPKVDQHRDLALNDRFLDDLQSLAILVEQAKSQPGVLNKIAGAIQSYISAMQSGTLRVTDTRPKE